MTALDLAEVDENIEHVRAQLLADVTDALHRLERATTHLDALRAVDDEFAAGRDGRDIHAHLDGAIRRARAAYAVAHMVADKERP
jgi:hypothetical protein